ncbi:MAG: carbohydrate porin, partial [Puniceicoccales bacterium]
NLMVTLGLVSLSISAFANEESGDKLVSLDEDEALATAWLDQDYFLGYQDWRAQLKKDTGLSPFGNYAVDLQSNVVGGQENATQYATLGFFGADLDLGILLDSKALQGWSLHAEGYNAEGRDISQNIGNAMAPSTLFSGVVSVGLGRVFLKAEHDEFTWKIGRLTPEDDFASSALWDYFVSLAYNDNPWNLSANNPNFSGAPGTLWMTSLQWQPNDQWSFTIGAANTSKLDLTDSSNHGVDFDFDPLDGTLFMAEVAYSWQAEWDYSEKPLTGSATFGGYYDTAAFPLLNPPARGAQTNRGLGAAWLILEQQFIAGKNPDDIGLTAWALGTWGGPERMATAPWFASAGFVYEGIFPGRPDDALGLGGSMVWFSDQLPGQNHESNIELTYLIQVTPWLQFQPDVQFIFDPSGRNSIDDAIVIGFQSAVTF